MSIVLCIEPDQDPLSWETFCKKTPPFSVAIDGYVSREPLFQEQGPRANFNHHEGVERLATRATCGQILISIRQGLFHCFQDAQ